MKFKTTTIISLLGLIICWAQLQSCTTSFGNKKNSTLILRTDTIGKSEEWKNIEQLFEQYSQTLQKDSNDNSTKIKLIELYLNEARISGNQTHYYKLAMQSIQNMLQDKNLRSDYLYTILSYKSSVLLSLHQFENAKKTALLALAINNTEADIYGALIDANVELGNYSEAIEYCDKMLTIRPDLRSYSRASYLREIHGDNQGAIEAMKMAVQSGAQGMENTEWARIYLGDLYLNKGALDTAKLMYESALVYRPNYAYANMGLAKIASINKNFDEAISYCKLAIAAISESSFIATMADMYEAKGDTIQAKKIRMDVLNLLIDDDINNKKETLIPHNGNRELSIAYYKVNDFKNALKHAQVDAKLRPNNIEANELLCKIYCKLNDVQNANIYLDKAMKTSRKNSHAIFSLSKMFNNLGLTEKASKMAEQATAINTKVQSYNLSF
jgi:tetratricopeptide (TPR) repeat protein